MRQKVQVNLIAILLEVEIKMSLRVRLQGILE